MGINWPSIPNNIESHGSYNAALDTAYKELADVIYDNYHLQNSMQLQYDLKDKANFLGIAVSARGLMQYYHLNIINAGTGNMNIGFPGEDWDDPFSFNWSSEKKKLILQNLGCDANRDDMCAAYGDQLSNLPSDIKNSLFNLALCSQGYRDLEGKEPFVWGSDGSLELNDRYNFTDMQDFNPADAGWKGLLTAIFGRGVGGLIGTMNQMSLEEREASWWNYAKTDEHTDYNADPYFYWRSHGTNYSSSITSMCRDASGKVTVTTSSPHNIDCNQGGGVRVSSGSVGSPTSLNIISDGQGYSTGTNIATTYAPGSGGGPGAGLTVNITSVSASGDITGIEINNAGTSFYDLYDKIRISGGSLAATVSIASVSGGWDDRTGGQNSAGEWQAPNGNDVTCVDANTFTYMDSAKDMGTSTEVKCIDQDFISNNEMGIYQMKRFGNMRHMYTSDKFTVADLALYNPKLLADAVARGLIPYSVLPNYLAQGNPASNPTVEGFAGGPHAPDKQNLPLIANNWTMGAGGNYPKPWMSASQKITNGNYTWVGAYAKLLGINKSVLNNDNQHFTCFYKSSEAKAESESGTDENMHYFNDKGAFRGKGIHGRIGLLQTGSHAGELGFFPQDWYDQDQGTYNGAFWSARFDPPLPDHLVWRDANEWWDKVAKKTIKVWYLDTRWDVEIAVGNPDLGDIDYFAGEDLGAYPDFSLGLTMLSVMVATAALLRW